MRRICGSYVYWYNRKYNRVGNLFQGKFKSEAVEDDAYFLIVKRYIYQNPIKSGLVNGIDKYQWSSYNEYVNKTQLVDVDFILNISDNNREIAIERFIEYNKKQSENDCLDIAKKQRITDEEARIIIKKVCQIKNAPDLQNIDRETGNMYLKELKEKYNLSIRQIERLTGINRGIALKA